MPTVGELLRVLLWPLLVAVLTTLRLLTGLLFSPAEDARMRGREA